MLLRGCNYAVIKPKADRMADRHEILRQVLMVHLKSSTGLSHEPGIITLKINNNPILKGLQSGGFVLPDRRLLSPELMTPTSSIFQIDLLYHQPIHKSHVLYIYGL